MNTYIFIGLLITTFVFATIIWNKRHRQKLRKLADSRPVKSKEDYISFYIQKDYPKEYIEAVYDAVQTYVKHDWFSMYPEDDLINDYDIDHEDLEESLMSVLKKKNLTLPDKSKLDFLNEKYADKLTAEHLIEVLSIEN
ncbi:hypothetical protein K6119_09690 [Paracrocinitomix mangrovi]|uniref:hypothetical protein n=1 Tax=Paracrocinitomix mangrovi TaxID=2862509 RepID=UPI001C8DF738|nr:hypothetical protein [Paracrocinitomix mangrovi]UKN03761.1 hypothetical protein K6119_09690 [Paracrocinitomix mangrovi]